MGPGNALTGHEPGQADVTAQLASVEGRGVGTIVRSFLADSLLYGLAGALGKALALLTVPFLTRSLAPGPYGLADLATSFAAIGTVVVLFCGDIPAARLRARARDAEGRASVMSAYVGATTVISVASAGLLLPLSGLIASTLWNASGETGLAGLALLLIPVSAVQVAFVTVLRLEGRAKAFALLSTVDLVAQLGLAVLLVLLGAGPEGVVIGFIAGSIIGMLASGWWARPYLRASVNSRLARKLVREGVPFLPSVTLFLAADQVSRYLVANAGGTGDVGLFGAAVRFASAISLVTGAFSLTWGPMTLARVPDERTASLIRTTFVAFCAAGGAVALAMGLVAPELISLVSGEEYVEAAAIMACLAIATMLSGAYYVLAIAAGVYARGNAVASTSAVGAIGQVLMTIALLPSLGLLGVGLAAIVGRGVAMSALLSLLRHELRASLAIPVGVLSLATAAGVAMGLLHESGSAGLTLRVVGMVVLIGLGTLAIVQALRRSPMRT